MSSRDRINRAVRRVPAWTIYIVGVCYAAWLFYLGATGGLGVEPIKALEHAYGEVALKLVVVGLAITPLRRYAGINLLKLRRAIGLVTFLYVCVHLSVWLVLDVQVIGEIWADIVKRPYITVGMAGFLAMIPLAITSNNRSVRKLGLRWRKLHQLTYAAAILGGLHFVMLVKGLQIEPLIYLMTILGLLTLRLPRFQGQRAKSM